MVAIGVGGGGGEEGGGGWLGLDKKAPVFDKVGHN